MKKRIGKYLSSKEAISYSQVDIILKMFVDGKIEKELEKYKFYDIEIFPSINKQYGNTIQINFKLYNLVATIDFSEDGYEYNIYSIGCSFEQVRGNFIHCCYSEDFSVFDLFEQILNLMLESPSLAKSTKLTINKKYKTIASICFFVPCVAIGMLALYVILSKRAIALTPWFLLVIVIPLVIWSVFDIKSKRT